MNLSWIRLYILFLALNVSTYSAYAANSCRSLFESTSSTSQIDTQIKNRRSTNDIDLLRNHYRLASLPLAGEIKYQFASTLLDPAVNLQIVKDKAYFSLRTEIKIQVNGEQRLKIEDLPLDLQNLVSEKHTPSDFVINAGLESGRKFLNDTLTYLGAKSKATGEQQAVFIFIDVNNLGWINKNFKGDKATGDLYIDAVARAIKKVIKSDGLIFRQGGDEFALVLPAASPEKLKSIMTDIRENVRIEAHPVFRSESIRRANLVRIAKRKFETNEISEQQYQQIIKDFRHYTAYSQEGLSMGAEYVDRTNVSDIFNKAESRALDMKLATKKAHQQDIKKYVGESINYSGAPKLSYRYDFPLVTTNFLKTSNTSKPVFMAAPTDNESRIPKIQFRHDQELNRLNGVSLVRLADQNAVTGIYAEYFNSTGVESYQKIEMNFNTDLPDLRDLKVQKIVKLLEQQNNKSQFIWVNLLNLGKLNYFKSGINTGDRALAIVSNILKKQLRYQDLILKGFGSEFLIMTNLGEKSAEKLAAIKARIEKALLNSAELHDIYLKQKSDLQMDLIDEQNPEKRSEITAAIAEIENLLSQPLVALKTAEVQNGDHDINSILDLLK